MDGRYGRVDHYGDHSESFVTSQCGPCDSHSRLTKARPHIERVLVALRFCRRSGTSLSTQFPPRRAVGFPGLKGSGVLLPYMVVELVWRPCESECA